MDYTDYSSIPIGSSADGLSTTATFFYPTVSDKAFIADPFTGPDPPFAAFDTYFGAPASSADGSQSIEATSCPPFEQFNYFSWGFPLDTNAGTLASGFDFNLLPLSDASQTPSLRSDGTQNEDTPQSADALQNAVTTPSADTPPDAAASQNTTALAFPAASPPPEQPHSSTHFQPPTPPPSPAPQLLHKPKRGRPRLDRSLYPLQHNKRLPHNQVERKYREGINASLERLRRAIPTLCRDDELSGMLGLPRPSKAAILEGAIERIREVEQERDLYRDEIVRLRKIREMAGRW